jgi:hypothetical protein
VTDSRSATADRPAGNLGYLSEVPLANELDAVKGSLDLEQAVADLHADGIPVIGRIVAFADPTLAPWAWATDRWDWVIQDNGGADFYRGSYAGVDHILCDYIRRPEGIDKYTVPGLTTTPTTSRR